MSFRSLTVRFLSAVLFFALAAPAAADTAVCVDLPRTDDTTCVHVE